MKWAFIIGFQFILCACSNEAPATSIPIEEQNDNTLKDAKEVNLPEFSPLDFDTLQWTELTRLEPGIILDMRYATTNNFVNEKMYYCARCFLRPAVATALLAAQRELQEQGLGFKMFDCYRPRPIQWRLWEKVPNPDYVADPRKGSAHNRGFAVDLTIVDNLGNELEMGTGYDFFGKEAHHSYRNLSAQILENRKLLLNTMKKYGFRPTATEWWHYSLAKGNYALEDWVWPCP